MSRTQASQPAVPSSAEEYRRDGVVQLAQALDADDLRLARALFDWSRAHPGQAAQTLDLGNGEAIYMDTHSQSSREHYLQALEGSRIPALVAEALGLKALWFLGEQIYVKQGVPGTAPTAWHQDSDLPIDATGAVCLWISFDRLEREDALTFVRGSHAGPRFNAIIGQEPGGEPAYLYPDASEKTPLPDVEARAEDFDLVAWPYEVGDALLFHSLTMHGRAPVPASGSRDTLCLRFFGPATRYLQLPERRPLGVLAAEATGYLWEGARDGEPLHLGSRFAKVFG